MLVRECMSRRVITVDAGQPLRDAERLLLRHRLRQVPVLRDGQLVGIITHRDLRGSRARIRTVAQAMTAKPVIIAPDAAVDEAARVLRTYKIGALPVVERKVLVGIIAAADLLDGFIALSGVAESTVRLTLVGGRAREMEARARRAVARGAGDVRWLHRDTRSRPARLHLRVHARRLAAVVSALEAAGFDVTSVVASSSA